MIDSKYLDAVNVALLNLIDIVYPDVDDKNLMKECLLDFLNKTEFELAEELEIGVKNGYSIEFQLGLISKILKQYSDVNI